MVKVSVIITIYNAAETVERAMNSLLHQTFNDYEVICIDDGSTDSTSEILEGYSKNSSKVRVFHQKNSGEGEARHNGINLAQGEYLMFCDADDIYEPEMIEEMYNKINNSNYDFVICDYKMLDAITNKISNNATKGFWQINYGENIITPEKIFNLNGFVWNKILRKDFIIKNNLEYPCNIRAHDDTEFMIKYYSKSKKGYSLDKHLYIYKVNNPNSTMGQANSAKGVQYNMDAITSAENILCFFKNEKPSEETLDYLVKFLRGFILHYYKQIPKQFCIPAYNQLKRLIQENYDIVCRNNDFIKIANSENIDDFEFEILGKDAFKKRLTLKEKIFSIKKIKNKLVLIVLGVNIKFKRKI